MDMNEITFDDLTDQIRHDLLNVVSNRDYPEPCNTLPPPTMSNYYNYCLTVLVVDVRAEVAKTLSNSTELQCTKYLMGVLLRSFGGNNYLADIADRHFVVAASLVEPDRIGRLTRRPHVDLTFPTSMDRVRKNVLYNCPTMRRHRCHRHHLPVAL